MSSSLRLLTTWGGTVRFNTLLTKLRSRAKLTNQELLKEALRRGEEAWESAGRDWKRFRQLRFRAVVDGEERVDTIGAFAPNGKTLLGGAKRTGTKNTDPLSQIRPIHPNRRFARKISADYLSVPNC